MFGNSELQDVCIEDIEDTLPLIEDSFGFTFVENDLIHVKSFGDFADVVKSKITLQPLDDCTSQQAFYKLRTAIHRVTGIDSQQLTTSSNLDAIFSKKQ